MNKGKQKILDRRVQRYQTASHFKKHCRNHASLYLRVSFTAEVEFEFTT